VIGRVLGGRYELTSLLGRGPMAEVWEAVDRPAERVIAVKVVPADPDDPSFLVRVSRESRVVARLRHPNIVTVHDVGVDDAVAYLVMELVPGGDLAGRLAGGPLDLAGAVRIAADVCDGLEAAHDAGFVHRNLTPANILLAETGRAKIVDFGLPYLKLDGVHDVRYLAPEQHVFGQLDARTDIYALGCVLHAMLTGEPPFTGDDPMRVALRHITEPPLRPGLPAGLDRLLDAMLAKRPVDRPASAARVRAVLRRHRFG
jgi:eukaryotic-like serine/threonine-protein kinase